MKGQNGKHQRRFGKGYLRDARISVRYLGRYKALFAANFGLILIGGITEGIGIGLIIPVFEQLQDNAAPSAISEVLTHLFALVGIPFSIYYLLAALATLMLIKYVAQALQGYVGRQLGATASRDFRNQAFSASMHVPLSQFHRTRVGDLTATVFTSAEGAGAIYEQLSIFLISIVFCFLYLFMALAISFDLSLAAGGMIAISGILLASRFRIGYRQGADEKAAIDRIYSYVVDKLTGFKTVREFDNADLHLREFRGLTDAFRRIAVQIQVNRLVADFYVEPLVTLLAIGLIAYSIAWVDIPLSLLMAFFVVLVRMVPRAKTASSSWLQILSMLPHVGKLQELFDLSDSEDQQSSVRTDAEKRKILKISFEEVGFDYVVGKPALTDINLMFRGTGTFALVGESGAGKSTIIDLLIGHHVPVRGRIMVDGRDLAEIPGPAWRRQIAVVPQDPHVFEGSVAANIRYGKLTASDDEVIAAARTAHAHDFITAMPEGYDTALGSRGAQISAGQRQRVALARAIVRDPSILILDEATSALDSESEAAIQRALEDISKEKMLFVVAHRLSTIVSADKIIVVEAGTVANQGTHAELLLTNETYRRYVALQSEI